MLAQAISRRTLSTFEKISRRERPQLQPVLTLQWPANHCLPAEREITRISIAKLAGA
jgi:hypothetical protein